MFVLCVPKTCISDRHVGPFYGMFVYHGSAVRDPTWCRYLRIDLERRLLLAEGLGFLSTVDTVLLCPSHNL